MLERFRDDETRILTNAMLLTEGYDEPSIDCVVCLRPTKVRALYSQIIGRGTRMCGGKDHLLVLDFLWQSGEHSLVKPAHLIAEDEEDAQALTEKLGDEGDIEEAREEVNADRTRKLTERLRRQPPPQGQRARSAGVGRHAQRRALGRVRSGHAVAGRVRPPRSSSNVLGKFGIDTRRDPDQGARLVPVGPAHHAPETGAGDAEAGPPVAQIRPPAPGDGHLQGGPGIPRHQVRQAA